MCIRDRRKDTLKTLYEKAATRNPDEFYHGMISNPTQGGLHVLKPEHQAWEEALTKDEKLVMSNQDIAYLQMNRQRDARKIARLQASLQLVEDKPPPKQHVVFVDSHKAARKFDPVQHFHTLPEFLDRTFNRPTLERLGQASFLSTSGDPEAKGRHARGAYQRPSKRDIRSAERERAAAYDELVARAGRDQQLAGMVQEMVLQKQVLGAKTKPKQIKAEDGTVKYKWKRQRSR